MSPGGSPSTGGDWRGRRSARLPLLVLAAGAALALWFVLGHRPAPVVPDDETHRTTGRPVGCLECHAKDGPVPQPASHTNRLACFSCHRAE